MFIFHKQFQDYTLQAVKAARIVCGWAWSRWEHRETSKTQLRGEMHGRPMGPGILAQSHSAQVTAENGQILNEKTSNNIL